MKTYSFKLYNSKRLMKLHRQINAAGMTYNHCIALHRRYYRLYKCHLSCYALQRHLTKLKKIKRFAYLKEFGSQAVHDVAERIDRAYRKFFNDLKRGVKTAPPKFKKVRKYKSFTLKQSGYKFLEDNTVEINKQRYRYFKSREIEGRIKTVTVKRDALRDIYVYIVCESEKNQAVARTGKSVGYDFGLKSFLTDDTGTSIASPLFFSQGRKAIASANKKLSRKKEGSHNRHKARLALARLHKRVANRRNNFHWEQASRIAGEYSLICIESLNIKGMKKLYGRKISDLGFSNFVRILKYAASKKGSTVVEIDKFYPSSQLCNDCGAKNPAVRDLKVREWTCPVCGRSHDRDINAARNIRQEGERIFFQPLTEIPR